MKNCTSYALHCLIATKKTINATRFLAIICDEVTTIDN